MTMTMSATSAPMLRKAKIINGPRKFQLENSPNDCLESILGQKRVAIDIDPNPSPSKCLRLMIIPSKIPFKKIRRNVLYKSSPKKNSSMVKFDKELSDSFIQVEKKVIEEKAAASKKKKSSKILKKKWINNKKTKKNRRSSFKKTVNSVESKNRRREENQALRNLNRASALYNRRMGSVSSSSSVPVQQVQQQPQQVAVAAADQFNLQRFTSNQKLTHGQLVSELKNGRKESHCIWHELPTTPYVVNGVEVGSSRNKKFAIRSDSEGIAYLQNDMLRSNYLEIVNIIDDQLTKNGSTLYKLVGNDETKVISSIQFFTRIANQINDMELQQHCDHVLALSSA